MKQVHKKSIDEAVNQILISAYKKHIDLSWDRAEAQQPQCGFGRLSICCSDCYAGPCRVNPFGADDQKTICGRDRSALAANSLVKKVADGSASLLKLAQEFGADVAAGQLACAMTAQDEMLAEEDFAGRLKELGRLTADALQAIQGVKTAVYGQAQPEASEVNLGALDAQAVNIVVHGHVAPAVIRDLARAAEQSAVPVNLTAICGADAGGALTLPVLTNYESQETVLLTGAVDLLVIGGQCVMPAMIALAQKENVPVVRAGSLREKAALEAALQTAQDAFRRRAGQPTSVPALAQPFYTGYASGSKLYDALKAGFAKGAVQGLVYLGGCGSIDNTQDAIPVKLAKQLLQDGYVIVTAGCAGTSLAKAGMTHPDYDYGNSVLKAALPEGIPAVLYLGSCHDAAGFFAIAEAVKKSGLPVFAVMPEITHHKTLATAAAFVASGITAFAGLEQIFADDVTAELLSGVSIGGARLVPLADIESAPRAWAEAAASK